MKVTDRFGIKFGLTAVSLAMMATLALHPAHAEARVGPLPMPQALHRMAEPEDVRSSISAVRTACASWPRVVNEDQASPPTPGLAAAKDSDLCDFVGNPNSLLWPARTLAVFLTIASFVVAAAVIGLMRMIFVAAWSWRPRGNIAPWV
jgi:hypothetical protein